MRKALEVLLEELRKSEIVKEMSVSGIAPLDGTSQGPFIWKKGKKGTQIAKSPGPNIIKPVFPAAELEEGYASSGVPAQGHPDNFEKKVKMKLAELKKKEPEEINEFTRQGSGPKKTIEQVKAEIASDPHAQQIQANQAKFARELAGKSTPAKSNSGVVSDPDMLKRLEFLRKK